MHPWIWSPWISQLDTVCGILRRIRIDGEVGHEGLAMAYLHWLSMERLDQRRRFMEWWPMIIHLGRPETILEVEFQL